MCCCVVWCCLSSFLMGFSYFLSLLVFVFLSLSNCLRLLYLSFVLVLLAVFPFVFSLCLCVLAFLSVCLGVFVYCLCFIYHSVNVSVACFFTITTLLVHPTSPKKGVGGGQAGGMCTNFLSLSRQLVFFFGALFQFVASSFCKRLSDKCQILSTIR
jgi:hypothetical protein